jgi:hypothetical protein
MVAWRREGLDVGFMLAAFWNLGHFMDEDGGNHQK